MTHPLNKRSQAYVVPLSRIAEMSRVDITQVRIPPGKESFTYHSHQLEDEFLYILKGKVMAEIDSIDYEVGPGTFMGFPTSSVTHYLRNPFGEELVCLMGGEQKDVEIADFLKRNKRMYRNGDDISISIIDYEHIKDFDTKPLSWPNADMHRGASRSFSMWRGSEIPQS